MTYRSSFFLSCLGHLLAVLPGAVHEDVQRLHMLQGEERDAGVNQEHPKENARLRPAVAAGGAALPVHRVVIAFILS